jgi:hypothetical protein
VDLDEALKMGNKDPEHAFLYVSEERQEFRPLK